MSDRSLPQRLTVAQIQAAVCEEFRIPAALFLTTPRGRIARARQVGMYLARELTLHSCNSIGRMFGGRDHATVVWAGNRVTVEMMADPAFAARVTTLEQRLRAPEMVEV